MTGETQVLENVPVDQRIMVIKNTLRRSNVSVILKNGRFMPEEAQMLLRIAWLICLFK